MDANLLYAIAGTVITALGATLLYVASPHQRLLRERPGPQPMLWAGLIALVVGLACWILSWGGLVGGLLALCVWMTVSVALPYLLARRTP